MAEMGPHITDAEFTVLETLWNDGPSTVRQIAEQLHAQLTHSAQASVDKLIQRLESKELVRRDRESFPHIVQATRERDEIVGQQLNAVAQKLSDGSLAPLIMRVISDNKLSADERKKLRDLLDQDDSPSEA